MYILERNRCVCFGKHNATTDICKSILWYNENIQFIDQKKPNSF